MMEGVAPGERHLFLHTDYDAGCHRVIVEIGDTSPGVSASITQRIFEPWETDKPGALGIGLSIAHTIAEGLGGRIRYERRPRGGALFRVELPVQGDADRDDRGAAAGPPGGR